MCLLSPTASEEIKMSATLDYECKCKRVRKNIENIFNIPVLICESCLKNFSRDVK